MDSYTISLASSVKRDLRKVDSQAVPRIAAAIDALADEPRPVGAAIRVIVQILRYVAFEIDAERQLTRANARQVIALIQDDYW